MNAAVQNTFELYVDDDRYAVPTLHLISALDEKAAVEVAWKVLSESLHHRGAELCQGDQRLAGLGSFATRRVPPDLRTAVGRD